MEYFSCHKAKSGIFFRPDDAAALLHKAKRGDVIPSFSFPLKLLFFAAAVWNSAVHVCLFRREELIGWEVYALKSLAWIVIRTVALFVRYAEIVYRD